MSKKIIQRLELAAEKIDQIADICKSKGVAEALNDELLAKPAIMKHIDVICQQFEELEKAQEYNTLGKFNKEDLKGLKQVGNWSSCDYDNIQNEIIERVIHTKFPKLKENIQEVIRETKKDLCKDLQKN